MNYRGGSADEARRGEILQLVRLRMAGDIPALLKFVAEDVVLTFSGPRRGGYPDGQWRGHDGLREILRRTEIDYEPLDAEVQAALVEGDHSVLRWTSGWRCRATGAIHDLDMAHFMRWRDGRIAAVHEFVDVHAESPGRAPSGSLDDLLRTPDPGLPREEMARRMTALCDLSRGGPNVALFRELCAPDIVCEFAGDRRSTAYAGRHHGIDALTGVLRAVAVDFEQFGAVVPEMVVDGDTLAARRRVEWRHRGTGRRGFVELADFVRFRD